MTEHPRIATSWRSLFEAGAEAGLPAGYFPCAGLALAAIWAHRYPAGIDLPQHANLVRLWLDLGDGPVEWHALYRANLFTPYLLAYAVAYPFAKWISAIAGIKVVLTLAALGTPWTLARWLRTVGGDAALGLVGFPVVFGFAYLWGFLSHCLALPLLFGYLASFEAQGGASPEAHPTPRQIFATTCWGVALFFCHGVTFGVAVVSAGFRVLLRRRPLGAWRSALHLVPLGALTLLWLHLRERKATADTNWWFIDKDRLVTLFSGLFWPVASVAWGAVTLFLLAIVFLVARPKMNRSFGAWIPFVIAAAGFVILPEYLASTYLVGTRFSVYVQAFAPALVATTVPSGRALRRLEIVTQALVLATLVLLNVRLTRFNMELDGFHALASRVPPNADVRMSLPKRGGASDVFGPRELSEVHAWVSADNGGLIENDSARYFQMPVQRQALHVHRYPYVFAHEEGEPVAARIHKAFPDAKLLDHAGGWFLFERPPLVAGSVVVVRSAQEQGELEEDKSVGGTPLSIAGVAFEHGLGTHARGFIRVRAPEGKTTLEGACGVDDQAPGEGRLSCRVRTGGGRVLFLSAPLAKGSAAAAFSVPLDATREVLLETLSLGSLVGDHADWVDLR